jgi:NADH-quinone oxidoreductase subunit N
MNFAAITPEIILTVGALVVMVIDVAVKGKRNLGFLTVLVILLAASQVIRGFENIEVAFGGMILADRYAHFFRLVIYLGALIAALAATGSWAGKKAASIFGTEYFGLMLIAIVGMDLLVLANNMMVLFLGLEILSLPLYAMAAGRIRSTESVEAGAKYFLNGAFASGFVVFGIALVYGATGSFSFDEIGRVLTASGSFSAPLWWIGALLMTIGLFFKIAAVPFHAWAPDVYAGAPTPTVAFFSAAPKAAAIGLLLRLTQTTFVDLPLEPVLWTVAWLSMLVGNLWALRQHDLKRLLAYSGIAHVGYALVGLTAGGSGAVGAVGFYLLGYAGMAVGAFTVICVLGFDGCTVTLESIAGLGKRSPIRATVLTIFMFAMAGIPPTVGFIGKFVVFTEAVHAGYIGLVIWAVLFSALSLYYYLRVVVAMWMWPESEAHGAQLATGVSHWALHLALIIAVAVTLILGIYPQPFLELAANSLFWLL